MADLVKEYASSTEVFADGLCLAVYNIIDDHVYVRFLDETLTLTQEQAKGLQRFDVVVGAHGWMSAFRLDDARKAANG